MMPLSPAAKVLAERRHKLRLVIFDCDGVLVDSEAITSRVVAQALSELGWPMRDDEARSRFLGMTLTDMEPIIAARVGHPIPSPWRTGLTDRIVSALSASVQPVPGAVAALDAADALGLPWCIASNSSHREMDAKFARIGIAARVQGRVHSHRDVGRGKPAPDLFLAAAAGSADPCECLVIEDSAAGVRGAMAAGMACLAYAPHDDGAGLAALGATPFHSMFDLPGLLALAAQVTA